MISQVGKFGARGTGEKRISLVDCMSFIVMRRGGIERVLAFDPDFQDQGFTIY
jgi:predicted nucleic acid-binding protein